MEKDLQNFFLRFHFSSDILCHSKSLCSLLFREHLKKQIQTEEGKIMGKRRRLSIKRGIMLVIVGFVLIQTEAFPYEPGLEFPFEPSSVINELMSFGVPAWGTAAEDHFGIDLIPNYQSSLFPPISKLGSIQKVKVVAPTEGTIRGIWAFDSTDEGFEGNKDISVILEMNGYWSIILMFEPKTSEFLRGAVEEQIRSIIVKAGQYVKKGDEIGYLVVGGSEDKYPHVHYALMYKHIETSYGQLFDNVPVPNFSPDQIQPEGMVGGVPRKGHGSPWDPVRLNLPDSRTAAFFCPYEFSSPKAKSIFDRILINTAYPCGPSLGKCNCVCIYDRCCDGQCCGP